MRGAARVALAWCLALAACATKAPPYQASIENVQALQRLPAVARFAIGDVRPDASNAEGLDHVSARTLSIEPPAGGYAQYLKDALQAELTTAGRLDPGAPRAINAVLVRNRLDTGGASVAYAEVAARFTVTRAGTVLYDKEQAASHAWDSSFLGNIAALRALQNYPVAFQKLVGRLFADPEFAAASSR